MSPSPTNEEGGRWKLHEHMDQFGNILKRTQRTTPGENMLFHYNTL